MRKKFLPFFLLIVCNIVLVLGTLYVTRHALYDLEHTVYTQRTHFKTIGMQKMAGYYYANMDSVSGKGLAKFLSHTVYDNTEIHILAEFKPDKGFPLIWIGGDPGYLKYQSYGTLRAALTVADSTRDIDRSEFNRFKTEIYNYSVTNEREPEIVTFKDGGKYLLNWVIIPEPTPTGAKYIYIVLTPTEAVAFSIEESRSKYVILFGFATLIAGMMMVLVPITLKRIA